MNDGIESIDLNANNVVNIDLGNSGDTDGAIPGIELLANNSHVEKQETYNSIADLEDSLNELVDDSNTMAPRREEVTKTWDGYGKYDAIPEKESHEPASKPEDTLHEKFKYLRLLEDLERKGVALSKKYDMESSLLEMKGEYETIIREKEKSNSVKFQGKMLMAFVTGVEFLNNKFDPFDVKMDGWGEQINENISEYDEIFGELHEKYKSKGKMAPEIKLMFQLAGSAIMIHMTNAMFKSSMPGMDDIMRQNPDLMQQFTKAAVDQMSQKNEGFGNFMSMSSSAQTQQAQPRTSRPDITFAREDTEKPTKSFRSEMKGPDDISEILSGLKVSDDTESNAGLPDSKQPKSKRRRRSDKNTISLNL